MLQFNATRRGNTRLAWEITHKIRGGYNMLGAPVVHFLAAEDMLYRELGSRSMSIEDVSGICNRLQLCTEWLKGLVAYLESNGKLS